MLAGQESFHIKPLLAANAWPVLDEDVTQLPVGALVEVRGLDGRGVLLRNHEGIDGH